jgi:hypothetical protein
MLAHPFSPIISLNSIIIVEKWYGCSFAALQMADITLFLHKIMQVLHHSLIAHSGNPPSGDAGFGE